MDVVDGKVFYILSGIFVALGVFLQARKFRLMKPQDKYDEFIGKVVKFSSAEINGQSYGGVIEFKLADEMFGVKCYFPKFSMVCSYDDIVLSKKKALVGSVVKISISSCNIEVVVKHRLAEKLDRYSQGRLKYSEL